MEVGLQEAKQERHTAVLEMSVHQDLILMRSTDEKVIPFWDMNTPQLCCDWDSFCQYLSLLVVCFEAENRCGVDADDSDPDHTTGHDRLLAKEIIRKKLEKFMPS